MAILLGVHIQVQVTALIMPPQSESLDIFLHGDMLLDFEVDILALLRLFSSALSLSFPCINFLQTDSFKRVHFQEEGSEAI